MTPRCTCGHPRAAHAPSCLLCACPVYDGAPTALAIALAALILAAVLAAVLLLTL